jgi:hypothetical protein
VKNKKILKLKKKVCFEEGLLSQKQRVMFFFPLDDMEQTFGPFALK